MKKGQLDVLDEIMTEMDYEDYRDELLDALRNCVLDVTFTKADGSERTMKCTLIQEMIPEEMKPVSKPLAEGETPKEPNFESIRVFDIEKQAWRSFRLDSIIEVSL